MRTTQLALVAVVIILAGGCAPAADSTGKKSADPQSVAHLNGLPAGAEDSFKFIVMSDRNGGNIPGVWPQAIEEVNLLKPEFIMTVGDFIQGYTEDAGELNRQWTDFLAENSKLDAPFFFCPGNHDITNAAMRQVYLERFGRDGKSYYSFDYSGCHFTVLDSTLFTKQGLDPNQLEWLKADMAKAVDSKHVFLFYHHPAGEKSAAWKQMQPLLAAGKTTVFNGHTHWLSYAKQDGIDIYTLAGTAADVGEENRDFGDVQMFAHVTVEDGQPTIAIVPVGQLLRADHVDRAFDETAWPLRKQCEIIQDRTTNGRHVTIMQSNNSPLTFDLSATIDGYGWQVVPREIAVSVKPGEKKEMQFDLVQWADDSQAASPQVKRVYTFADPRGKPALLNMTTALGRFSTIRKTAAMTVDGKLDDWAAVKAENLPAMAALLTDGSGWSGDEDFRAQVRLAHDGATLYAVVEVADDTLRAGLTPVTENDGFGLSWSVPKDWQSGEPNMPVTGSVRLIPVAGKVEPIWAIGKKLTKPTGFKAVAVQSQHGYICELAMPLSEIGAKSPAEASRILNWRIQFRDIDGAGKPADVFTVGGTVDPKLSADTWVGGVLE
jgi:predicted phosphodiesterase